MAVINAVKLTREWFNKSQYGINQNITDEDITVKAHINVPRSFHWQKTSGKNDGSKCEQQVTIANHKPAALAQISVASSDNFTRVVLKKGVVRGLEGKQTICLPLDAGLVKQFGDSIELDLSQAVHEDLQCHERPSNGPALKEKSIARGSTSAVIHYKKMESEWKFTCQNATLTATAIIDTGRGTVEANFTEIIRELKQDRYRDDLDDIKVEHGKVRFTISGKVVFRWDSEHKVVW